MRYRSRIKNVGPKRKDQDRGNEEDEKEKTDTAQCVLYKVSGSRQFPDLSCLVQDAHEYHLHRHNQPYNRSLSVTAAGAVCN